MGRNRSKRTLFVLACYDWMRDYAMSVVGRLFTDNCHVVAVLEQPSKAADFARFPGDKVTIIEMPGNAIARRAFVIYPLPLIRAINRIIKEKEIELVYSVTIDTWLSRFLPRLQRHIPVLYTIHNAIAHETVRESLLKRINHHLLFAAPANRLVKKMKWTVTNSVCQQTYLRNHFPAHTVHFMPFPSLVNKTIATGDTPVAELEGKERYILFFGRIELYKGVHLLYDAYRQHPELHSLPLVIAGSGNIYFEHDESDNIVFVNRFIADEEVARLFSRAAVVVYPYTSATQSGVLSIASYFDVPMVIGDVPYFREVASGKPGIEIVDAADSDLLAQAITKMAESGTGSRPLYNEAYSEISYKQHFDEIADDTINAFKLWKSR